MNDGPDSKPARKPLPLELSAAENWYAHERVEALMRANPEWANATLGKALDVSGMTIGRIRSGQPVGIRVGTRLAKLLGMTWDEFQRRAEEEYAARPPEPSPEPVVPHTPAVIVVEDPRPRVRFENQHKALALSGEPEDSELGMMFLSMRHKLRADKPLDWWLDRLRHFREILKAESEQTAQEALEAQYRQNQMLDAVQEKVQPATEPPSKPRKKPPK